MEEVELKFLDVDPEEIKSRLASLKAKFVFDKIYKRRVFDFPDRRLSDSGAYVRVRDEGGRVVMTFKRRKGVKEDNEGKFQNDEGMEEWEVEVSDFDKAVAILKGLGLVEKFYEENRRIRYELKLKDGVVEVDIDFWPLISPYVEIEGENIALVEEAAKKLGFDLMNAKRFTTMQVYELNGINENDYSVITFEKQIKKVKT